MRPFALTLTTGLFLSGAATAAEFDMATNMSGQSFLGDVAKQFAEDVRTTTSGEVVLEFHEGGDLVPVPEILNAVSTGAVPAAFTWTGFFAGTVPAGKYFAGTPFGPPTEILVSWMWDGGGKEILQEAMDPLSVRVLPCNPMPQEAGGYFNKEMTSLEDFDGLRIRFGGWGGDVLRKLGASVTQIPGGEIYLSLERGRLDATEYASPIVDESFGFYDLTDYYYFPGWHQSTTWNSFVMNMDVWNSLSELQQQQIELACRVTVQRSMSQIVPEQIAALERMQADGDFEVKRFPDELLVELHGLWMEVLQEDMEEHPLLKKAHESLEAHKDRTERWYELQALPDVQG